MYGIQYCIQILQVQYYIIKMIKTLLLILLACFATCQLVIDVEYPPCAKVTYEYHILSLTWPNEFCAKTACDPNWKNMWDNKTMTIHGFWPSSTNLAYLSCQQQYGHDPYCYKAFNYNQSLFNASELALLNKYWPMLTKDKTLWNHEWGKHGTCYLHIEQEVFHSGQTDPAIFKKYYLDTVTRARSLDIRLVPSTINSKADLANTIGRRPSQFSAVCDSGKYLTEIKICYSLNDHPGTQSVRDCPAMSDTSCNYPIIVSTART